MAESSSGYIVVGKIGAPHGIKGWVKIHSYTEEPLKILDYSPWFIKQGGDWQTVEVLDARPHGRVIVASLQGNDSRDQAEQMKNIEIAVQRQQLPAPATGEYYWVDLIGLQVINTRNEKLGIVDRLMETGANDVLVVREQGVERLIPYVPNEFVLEVNLDEGFIQVDWDSDF